MASPARRFLLCIERFDEPDGRVWAVADWVRGKRRWRTTRTVDVSVPVTTTFRGRSARQPKAYLTGRGRIAWSPTHTVIHG